MIHYASPAFWDCYQGLPGRVKIVADKNFALLKDTPKHPSLHFKRVGIYWSVRAGIDYRALAVPVDGGVLWFWIGPHAEYDRLLR